MKKIIFLMIGILLIGSLFVNAIDVEETDIRAIDTGSRVSQTPGEPRYFNFWDWLFGTGRAGFEFELDQGTCSARYPPYRSNVLFEDKTNKNIKYGVNCNVGEYIKLVGCYDKAGTDCEPVFLDFYLKEYNDDRLRLSQECVKTPSDGITNCNERDWFVDRYYSKYVGYDCMICEEEEPVANMDARIISYNIPDESIYGNIIEVTANIKFLADGKYYVEAGLRESSETMSVIDISRALSQCDASPQYDGRYEYVGEGYATQAGNTKSYTFKFKDYGTIANYKVDIVVTNGCAVGPDAVNNYEAFDIKTESISIVSGLPPTVECDCGVCDADDKCIEKRYTGNDCPCNVECWSDSECVDKEEDDDDGNGNGDGSNKATQISFTKEEWATITKEQVLKSTCAWTDQCKEKEGYNISCITDDEIKGKIRNAKSGLSDIMDFVKILTGAGEIQDGTCRATKPFNYCQYVEPFGFFEITDSKCNDGLIILVGGLALLFFVPYFLGGGKK